jgi:hypothetical protein
VTAVAISRWQLGQPVRLVSDSQVINPGSPLVARQPATCPSRCYQACTDDSWPGGTPYRRANARLNDCSDEYPTARLT